MKMKVALGTEVDHPKIVGFIEHTQDMIWNKVNSVWYQMKKIRGSCSTPKWNAQAIYITKINT